VPGLGSQAAAGRLRRHENSERGWLNIRRPPIGAAAGRSLRKLSGRSLSCCLSPTTPRARVGMAERALRPLPRPSVRPFSFSGFRLLSLLPPFRSLSGTLPFYDDFH